MAVGNSTTVTVEIDVTTGGALTDYSDEVLNIGDFEITNDQVDDTPFATAAAKYSFTGTYGAGAFPVRCEVDTTAGSLYLVLKAARGSTRSVKITQVTGEYVSCECNVVSFKRINAVKAIGQAEAVFQPTGAITES